jgi:CRISPR-associated endonuclease/helicase Cas3
MKNALAKPSGITLVDHVRHVVEEAQNILDAFPFSIEKYARLTGGKDLSKWLIAAAKYHDDGKKHPQWQKACQRDYDAFLSWQKQNGGTLKDYERAVKEKAGEHLRKANLRHEIASLHEHRNHNFCLPIRAAIAAHHAKLSVRHEHRWKNDIGEDGYSIWTQLRRESKEGINLDNAAYHDFSVFLDKYPSVSGIRAWLVAADQRASGIEGNPDVEFPKLSEFDYKFPFEIKKEVQRIAEEYWEDDFLLIRAPTGAGKTDASLLWAKKQVENRRAERLIIAMPTRFTSNALAINVKDSIVSETGLYHSSAWFNRYQDKIDAQEISRQEAREEHEFSRKLLTPVTVCTIDHLLMAFTLTREDHHQILFNLMNSCLVIDEADFYDDFTQANILVLLEALNAWKVPVMLMSASLPEVTKDLYEKSGYKISEIREDKSDLDRKRCELKSISKAESIDELSDLLEESVELGAGVIYANTVDRAMEFYKWFNRKDIKPILYHSRFTEPDKKKKEAELLAALGKTGTGKGIAILTQIGEMSVNISADWMMSDICPIDRLVQRVGRLCRFEAKTGILHVVIPIKKDKTYPAPYGTYKRPDWIAHRAFVETEKLIKVGEKYSAGDFVKLINQVYPKNNEFDIKASKNANNLKEYFVNNWLISSVEMSREDDEKANFWKSRDIEGNVDVFVEIPEKPYFRNWLEFQNYKSKYAISIHPYLVRKGLEKSYTLKQKKAIIGEDTQIVTFLTKLDAYSFDKGLNVTEEADEFP